MTGKYILEGKTPVRCDDVLKWGTWLEERANNRHVACQFIGDVRISTVFLGIDHNFGDGPPLLFETMIFGGKHADYQTRVSTWTEAEAEHSKALELVRTDDEAP